MQQTWEDGRAMEQVANTFIKPNDRLTSFDRLEIYNKQYWFRVLDCFYDDYPGLAAILGDRKFARLARAYLAKHPSTSFTLRNLGQYLEQFLRDEPKWTAPRTELALEMAHFEWAQIVAFDGEARPILAPSKLQKVTPSRLRLGPQPYLSLLELNYPIDDFSIALKRQKTALRKEASNAFESAPRTKGGRSIQIPRRLKKSIHVAVHRHQNGLFYKSIEPEAYRLLLMLKEGRTVTQACDYALRNAVHDGRDWVEAIRNWFEDWTSLGWFCSRSRNPAKAL
jgi:hypothetical protein